MIQTIEADPDGDIASGGGPLTPPVTTFVYDADGNQTKIIDARGSVTQWEYDA